MTIAGQRVDLIAKLSGSCFGFLADQVLDESQSLLKSVKVAAPLELMVPGAFEIEAGWVIILEVISGQVMMRLVQNECEDHDALSIRFIVFIFDKGAANPQQRVSMPIKDEDQTKKRLVDTYLHDGTLHLILDASLPLSSPFFYSLRQRNTLEPSRMPLNCSIITNWVLKSLLLKVEK